MEERTIEGEEKTLDGLIELGWCITVLRKSEIT